MGVNDIPSVISSTSPLSPKHWANRHPPDPEGSVSIIVVELGQRWSHTGRMIVCRLSDKTGSSRDVALSERRNIFDFPSRFEEVVEDLRKGEASH